MSSLGFYLYCFLSYKTQEKSAIPFGQGQILNPYSSHYKMTFAFSLIFYPPEDSVFVTSDLLIGSTYRMRLCKVYPVVSIEVHDVIKMVTFSAVGIVFSRSMEDATIKPPTYLLVIAFQGFWLFLMLRSLISNLDYVHLSTSSS